MVNPTLLISLVGTLDHLTSCGHAPSEGLTIHSSRGAGPSFIKSELQTILLELVTAFVAPYLLDIKKPTWDHKVLLVDDEADILDFVTKGLESNGFKVDAFRVPLGALSYFRPRYYDTIILDVRMQG